MFDLCCYLLCRHQTGSRMAHGAEPFIDSVSSDPRLERRGNVLTVLCLSGVRPAATAAALVQCLKKAAIIGMLMSTAEEPCFSLTFSILNSDFSSKSIFTNKYCRRLVPEHQTSCGGGRGVGRLECSISGFCLENKNYTNTFVHK